MDQIKGTLLKGPFITCGRGGEAGKKSLCVGKNVQVEDHVLEKKLRTFFYLTYVKNCAEGAKKFWPPLLDHPKKFWPPPFWTPKKFWPPLKVPQKILAPPQTDGPPLLLKNDSSLKMVY